MNQVNLRVVAENRSGPSGMRISLAPRWVAELLASIGGIPGKAVSGAWQDAYTSAQQTFHCRRFQ